MPVTAIFLKVLRVTLEYGMLFWLVLFVLRLSRRIFQDYRRQARAAADGKDPAKAALAVVEAGGRCGRRYAFSGQIAIGRGTDNDIVIPEGYVSHHHAVVYEHGGQYVAEDLGSRNHTYVNGALLSGRRYLRPGDTIRIGTVTLRFER